MNGCNAQSEFAIKSVMRDAPYLGISFGLLLGISIFGYQLKIFEGPLSDASGQHFDYYYNCLWVTIITITTVGYGDIYPKTHFGRFVGITACLSGYVMISLFVVTITSVLHFSVAEENSYTLLKRLDYREEIKKRAIVALGSAMRQRNAKMRLPRDEKEVVSKEQRMQRKLKQFSSAVENIRLFIEPDNDTEVMRRLISGLSEQVDEVKTRQDNLDSKVDLILNILQ